MTATTTTQPRVTLERMAATGSPLYKALSDQLNNLNTSLSTKQS